MKTEVRGSTSSISLQNPSLLINPSPQKSVSGALHGCLGSLDGTCIEKLLLHCASALENNDATLAQQVMWVLNNVASSSGDPNQRLTSWFLRALISRASRVCPTTMKFNGGSSSTSTTSNGSSMIPMRLMSVTELAEYVDLIPWHRFGFCASNSAIFKATLGYSRIHIIDFSITHCMQWPTLIDALAKRPQGIPALRISVVPAWRPPVPPFLNVSTEEVGQRLANFAKFKEVPFEFCVIDHQDLPSNNNSSKDSCYSSFHYDFLLSRLNPTELNLREDEALVINCQNWLRYLPDECQNGRAHDHDQHHQIMNASSRDVFLDVIKGLNPRIITIVDEDSDLGARVSSLTSRITTCFNFVWIPFDALETFLSKDNLKRIKYEADIGLKIENIIGFEGGQRVERLESGTKLSQRMKDSGYFSTPFCEESVREVKELLDEHASGWGMKNEEDMLVLTWKGHNSVYATSWVPGGFEEIN